MGYLLYREIRDNAPEWWTASERLVALMIADDANDDTRRSWIKIPQLMERTGLRTERGLRMVFQKLADGGFEFRMPLSKDKQGRPVFAVKGRSLDFMVPRFAFAPPTSVGGTSVPPNETQGGTSVPPNGIKEEPAFPVGGTTVPPLSSQSSPHKDQKMASRRGASSARAATLTNQDKTNATREAAELVYGTNETADITDEEMLWLADDKLPKDGRPVRSVRAYMEKIFADTPCIDTLLAGLDPGDDPDDMPTCPRCQGTRAELDPDRGICAWCVRELIINGTSDPAGWNPPILSAISKSLFVATGKSVDREWCARVADQLLTGRKVPAPVKYVIQAIETDKNPSRFLPTPIPPQYARAS